MLLPRCLQDAMSLSKDAKAKFIKTLRLLVEDFRHPSLQCKRVQGARVDLFECRIDQELRLLYDVSEGSIRCWHLGHHDSALLSGRTLRTDEQIMVDDIDLDDDALLGGQRQAVVSQTVDEVEAILSSTSDAESQ